MKVTYLLRSFRVRKDFFKFSLPVKAILFTIFIYYLGWGIVTPFLPLYFKSKLGSYSNVGLITGILQIFAMIWALLLAAFIDRVSKRKLIYYSLFLYLPFSYFFLELKTLFQFISFRIYHAILATSFWVSGEAYLRSHSPKSKTVEVFGFFDAMSYLALVLGAILGAYLITKFGFDILYAISFFAVIAFLFSLFYLPDHQKNFDFSFKIGSLKEKLKDFFQNKALVKLSGFSFFFGFSTSYLAMLIPLFLSSEGTNYWYIGIVNALFYLPFVFEPVAGILRNKNRIIFYSLFSSGLLFLVLFFITDLQALFLIFLTLAVGLTLAAPIISGHFTNLIPKKEMGSMSGIIYMIKSLAAGIGPIAAGVISDWIGLKYCFLLSFLVFLGLILIVKKFDFEN